MKTLATLRTNAKVRADMEDSSFVSDAEWLQFLNTELKALYDFLVKHQPTYFEVSKTYTVTVSTTDYTLPNDFYKLLDADIQDPTESSRLIPMYPFNPAERGLLQDPLIINYSTIVPIAKYQIRGNIFRVLPQQTAGDTFRIRYIPYPQELVNDTDELSDRQMDHWSEYIWLGAAAKALSKEESEFGHLRSEQAVLLERLKDLTPTRDLQAPLTVQDRRWG